MKRLLLSFLAFLIASSPAFAAPPGATSVQATAGSGTSMGTLLDASGRNGPMVGVCDGAASPAFNVCLTVLGASTAAGTSNPSIVVQPSPNGIGGATATPMPVSPTTTQQTAANPFFVSPSNNSFFAISATNSANTVLNPIYVGIADGTNGPLAVKAASTPAVAADKAGVFAISPNNTLVGLKDSGGTDMTNTAAHALNVSQPTASNLNATVTPSANSFFSVSATNGANTASNPIFVTPANNTFQAVSPTNGANVAGNPFFMSPGTGAIFQVSPTTAANTSGNPFFVSSAPTTATAWGIYTTESTSSGQSGVLGMCASTTSAPTNTNAKTDWLSCTTAGAQRVDVASVVGTATVTAASGVMRVGIAGNTNATIDAALGSASTNAVTVQGATGMTPVNTLAQPATGTAQNYAQQVAATLTTTSSHTYSAGQALGGLSTLTVTGVNQQSGYLTALNVESVAGSAIGMVVYTFKSSPASTCTDGNAFAPTAADLDAMIGNPQSITLATSPGMSTPSVATALYVSGSAPFVSGAAAKTIYVCLVNAASYTSPASSSADEHIRAAVSLN